MLDIIVFAMPLAAQLAVVIGINKICEWIFNRAGSNRYRPAHIAALAIVEFGVVAFIFAAFGIKGAGLFAIYAIIGVVAYCVARENEHYNAWLNGKDV